MWFYYVFFPSKVKSFFSFYQTVLEKEETEKMSHHFALMPHMLLVSSCTKIIFGRV